MNRRTKRVASLVKSELSRLLVEDVSDPALRGVVITDVALTDNLNLARIYFSRFQNAGDLRETEKGLRRARQFLRRKLGDNLDLRAVPELRFLNDEHGESLSRMMSLLDQLREERGGASV